MHGSTFSTTQGTSPASSILWKVEMGTNTARVTQHDKSIGTDAMPMDARMAECISKLKNVQERLEFQPQSPQPRSEPWRSERKTAPISEVHLTLGPIVELVVPRTRQSTPAASKVSKLEDISEMHPSTLGPISEQVVPRTRAMYTSGKLSRLGVVNQRGGLGGRSPSILAPHPEISSPGCVDSNDAEGGAAGGHGKVRTPMTGSPMMQRASLARKQRLEINELLRSASLPESESLPRAGSVTVTPKTSPKLLRGATKLRLADVKHSKKYFS